MLLSLLPVIRIPSLSSSSVEASGKSSLESSFLALFCLLKMLGVGVGAEGGVVSLFIT